MKTPKATPTYLTILATGILSPALAALAADPAPAAPPGWETSATAGATVTRGNSRTLLFTAGLLAQKKWDKNELRLGLDGAY
ncbi:MAG: hypothetical protein HYR88_02370, partial [Verrucomicrobia bacterium]|nr:hypothetical protein [Verrucomicrobiota bacterium]